MNDSPISKITLDGRDFLVKRDDLIDPYLAGNKYRKLYPLLQTPSNKLNRIISYGGTQSNAMLAIAAMCKNKGWEFIYYTKTLSKIQREQNCANYFHAKRLGMCHMEVERDRYKQQITTLRPNLDEKTFIIDQGGAIVEAKEGLEVLAKEIREVNLTSKSLARDFSTGGTYLNIKSLATPSGTGTTALYLALALPEYRVYTTPAIGNVEYLKEQMEALHKIPDNLVILKPKRKYHFAKLYPEFLEIYKKTLASGIEFDLLYAPGMWKAILEQTDEDILYIHSGGVSGNESMLQRYRQKGMEID
ncbi:MAG: 1-aminocyclopropane-1-carboxylate deaminase [Campylobacterota bacterium]|nr:1-aminocyclopropane-1-carboxylate deaminase [Campylobacterota bacterium]